MVYKKIIFILLAGLLLESCAGTNSFDSFMANIQKSFRTPGEKLLQNPDTVWKEHNCDQIRLPLVAVEENELIPPMLKPGEDFNHHLVYSMCPARPSEVYPGDLYRIIYYKGEKVFEDVSRNFEFKPGKWSVDAFINIPAQANPGIYSLEVRFMAKKPEVGRGIDFKKVLNIIVEK